MSVAQQKWGFGLPDQADHRPAPSIEGAAADQRPLQHLRGDIVGGFTAAMLSIPVSMGYGLLAFSALGEAYVPQAILAGLYAPVFGCLVAFLLGANTTMIYSPRSIVTFLIGSLVLHSLAASNLPALHAAPAATLFVLSLLLVFIAGCFQTLFGLMRLGTFVKYIPAPVIAGFQNAAAILIFLSQLEAMFGFRSHISFGGIISQLALIQLPTLFVGVLTCAVILRGSRLTKRIPPTILGLIVGVFSYYVLVALGLGGQLSATLANIPLAWPDAHYFADFVRIGTDAGFLAVMPTLIAGALSLAVVASLDGMLCARLVEMDSGNRVESNRELIRLGVGNMVSAGFGGIANGINLGSSFANHRSGGRTRWSVLVHALVILATIVAFSPLVSYLPRVVIAAMLVVVSIQLVDRWTLQILQRILKGGLPGARSMLLDLLIIAVVTTVAVSMNIVFAVGIGVIVTMLFFLFRMSKSVIRRSYRGDAVHSRKTREPQQAELLAVHGSEILVLELEGPLFFGTAENLAAQIEAALQKKTLYLVLDMRRVNEIDSTGAKIILQTHDRLTRNGRFLLVSGLEERPRQESFLRDMGVLAAITRSRLFHDTDLAIEWAEEHLILREMGDTEVGAEFPFARLDVFAHMNETELADFKAVLTRRTYRKGDVVFREGEAGKELYIIAKGTASVRLGMPGTDRATRLLTFAPGTVFGEMALLDEEARSATVEADEDLTCYVLGHACFVEMTERHPLAAIKLLANLGRELASRLRRANRTIHQLAT
ncbi:MAG: SulP family inorganic anion transporter [Burkholderiales bacterium]